MVTGGEEELAALRKEVAELKEKVKAQAVVADGGAAAVVPARKPRRKKKKASFLQSFHEGTGMRPGAGRSSFMMKLRRSSFGEVDEADEEEGGGDDVGASVLSKSAPRESSAVLSGWDDAEKHTMFCGKALPTKEEVKVQLIGLVTCTSSKAALGPLFAVFILWMMIGTVWYIVWLGWSFDKAFYFAAQAGFSVGFGALNENYGNAQDPNDVLPVWKTDITKLVTVAHVLSSSAVVGGCLSFFMEVVMARKQKWFDETRRTQRVVDKYQRFQAELAKTTVAKGTHKSETDAVVLGAGAGPAICDKAWRDRIWIAVCCNNPLNVARGKFLRDVVKGNVGNYCDKHFNAIFPLTLLVVWFLVGVAFGVFYEEWTLATSIYYSVTAMSTGGLQAPTNEPFNLIFTGIFVLVGVPLFGMALAIFSTILTGFYESRASKDNLSGSFSSAEMHFVSKLADADVEGKGINKLAYVEVQLLRQGAVAEDEISSILSRFSRLDLNGDGDLSALECVADAVYQQLDKRDPRFDDCVTIGVVKAHCETLMKWHILEGVAETASGRSPARTASLWDYLTKSKEGQAHRSVLYFFSFLISYLFSFSSFYSSIFCFAP